MKNIIDTKPTTDLHGRSLYSTKFIDDVDINRKIILDIGCGYGWFQLNILKKNFNKIIGIELTEDDLSTAKNNIKNEKIEFKVGNATDLPFKESFFDTVVSWEVVEHILKNSESKMFSEVNRVLKNNGVFYLSTPYYNFFSNIFDPAWWLTRHRHYKINDLIIFAKNNGFKAEKIILNGGFWEILGINNLYVAKWVFRRDSFFKKFFDKKQDEEYIKEKGITNIFMKLKKIR